MTDKKQDAGRHVDAIIQHIRSNIETNIRRTGIAKAVYLNPNYMSRLFKCVMNITHKEYITAGKMKLARTLLKSTTLPIGMVAVKAGYTNFSHFSQVYKSIFGTTPVVDRQDAAKDGK